MTEGLVRVAIASTPAAGSDRGVIAHEVDLAKAALLYADEVEMISLSVSMMNGLRLALGDDQMGMVDLLDSLDEDTLRHLGGGELPADWANTFRTALSLDPDLLDSLGIEGGDQLREAQQEFRRMTDSSRADLQAVLEEAGAAELVPAIKAGVLSVADLQTTPATTLRPAALGPADPADPLDAWMWRWLQVMINRMESRNVRLLFDEQVGDFVATMISEGIIEPSEQNLRLSRQASIGSGLVARLPAFPQAPMDELLDLRGDLKAPLTNYRASVTRLSKELSGPLGSPLEHEVSEQWDSQIVPQIRAIEDQLAGHGLVRELAKHMNVKDVKSFLGWTAGTFLVLDNGTGLGILLSGVASAAVPGATRVGQAALDLYRERQRATGVASKEDMFFLYEANERLQAFREAER